MVLLRFGVLGIQDIYHFTSRDIGYYPFLLPGIWDTWFNIFVTSRDIEKVKKIIMGIFADLKGMFVCLLQGIWDLVPPPPYTSLTFTRQSHFFPFVFSALQAVNYSHVNTGYPADSYCTFTRQSHFLLFVFAALHAVNNSNVNIRLPR